MSRTVGFDAHYNSLGLINFFISGLTSDYHRSRNATIKMFLTMIGCLVDMNVLLCRVTNQIESDYTTTNLIRVES